MPRKLLDPTRSKAIVNDAWERIKKAHGHAPNWPYMGIVQIVDAFIVDMDDARDVGDALVLCFETDEPVTKRTLRANMARVERGRQGTAGYR